MSNLYYGIQKNEENAMKFLVNSYVIKKNLTCYKCKSILKVNF